MHDSAKLQTFRRRMDDESVGRVPTSEKTKHLLGLTVDPGYCLRTNTEMLVYEQKAFKSEILSPTL